jgi:hypothetical protein
MAHISDQLAQVSKDIRRDAVKPQTEPVSGNAASVQVNVYGRVFIVF